jgi:hypothetical protein
MTKTKPMVQGGQIWDEGEGRYRDGTSWDLTAHLLTAKVLFELEIAPRFDIGGYRKVDRWPCPSTPLPVGAEWQPDDPFIRFLEIYVMDRVVAKAIFDMAFDN